MHLRDRINSGMLFYEHGHTNPVDIQQENSSRRSGITAKR